MPASSSVSLAPAVAHLTSAVGHHELVGASVLDALAAVPDPRKPRGVRQQVTTILALDVCAVLAGARSFTAIGEGVVDASDQVLTVLGASRAPGESTIRHTLGRLDGDELDTAIRHWAATRTPPAAGTRRAVALDGKTVRGSTGGDDVAGGAGVAPGTNTCAGHNLPGTTTHADTWLLNALGDAAAAATRTKNSYLSIYYTHSAKRRGPRRALVAVMHKILVAVWHMLTNDVAYHDLGADYFLRRPDHTARRKAKLLRELAELGVDPQQPRHHLANPTPHHPMWINDHRAAWPARSPVIFKPDHPVHTRRREDARPPRSR